jgi:hypothetical protein
MIWTKSFWKGAAERAIKTFFQTFVALIGTAVVIADVDWVTVASGSVLATLLSVATSIAQPEFVAGDNRPIE